MGILDLTYPLDLTDDEEAAGFEVQEAPSGLRAVVRDLDNGLRVLKTFARGGDVQYSICDAECHPLYPPSQSLAEVEQRFGKPPVITKKPSLGDPEILLLLDNLELLSGSISRLPDPTDALALMKRVGACKAVVMTWRHLAPSIEQRSLVRREVLALRNAVSNLRLKGKPPLRLVMLRPALYQATVLSLNAAGAPLPHDELLRRVSARISVDAAIWQAFLDSAPVIVPFSDGKVGLIPRDVPGGEKAMSSAQYEVVRLLRIAHKSLTLRELVVLLKYQEHPSAQWDLPLLRNVLSLEPRLAVAGDHVTVAE